MAIGSNKQLYDGVLKTIIVEDDKSASQRESVSWLRNNAESLLRSTKPRLNEARAFPTDIDREFLSSKMDLRAIGRMVMYVYDPKWKDKLPYYDTFPLIFVVDFNATGWTGLNLHYLPPLVRVRVIESLLENYGKKGRSERTKIKTSYTILQKLLGSKLVDHCFKRYLSSHVQSQFMFVDPKDWKLAVQLPTEKFKKKSARNVQSLYSKPATKRKPK